MIHWTTSIMYSSSLKVFLWKHRKQYFASKSSNLCFYIKLKVGLNTEDLYFIRNLQSIFDKFPPNLVPCCWWCCRVWEITELKSRVTQYPTQADRPLPDYQQTWVLAQLVNIFSMVDLGLLLYLDFASILFENLKMMFFVKIFTSVWWNDDEKDLWGEFQDQIPS